MKNDDQAWRQLQQHAADQLPPEFARRVLGLTRGVEASAAWAQLRQRGAQQLRSGFAERVLRAARAWSTGPSIWDQLAMCTATMAFCLCSVLFLDARAKHSTEQANLASWAQLATEVEDVESAQ